MNKLKNFLPLLLGILLSFGFFTLLSFGFLYYQTHSEINPKDYKWLTHVSNGDRGADCQTSILKIISTFNSTPKFISKAEYNRILLQIPGCFSSTIDYKGNFYKSLPK